MNWRGAFAGHVLDRLRGFARANALAAVILLALVTFYVVLDSTTPPGAADPRSDQQFPQISPDGRFGIYVSSALTISPGGHELRSLTVQAEGTAFDPTRTLTSLQLTGFVEAHWSPDSKFIAIITVPELQSGEIGSAATRMFLLAVSLEGASRLELPPAVDPERLLAGEEAAAEPGTTSVSFVAWRGDTLGVVSTGHGWVGPPAAPESRQVGVQCRFDLEVSAQQVRELSRAC
ncbi:MAG: hypothetical protein Q8W45_00510 [Candidatus Palauibacterales bacterium]|nr:hypothetical protein [Candidatus Palauibacterales bacterium]MDP2481735.1 hypothetical protein [Candidatus Palauibacterales bacterium]